MAARGALNSWQEMICQHRVVLFTDSPAVRGSFLKSWSANEDSDRLMDVIFDTVWIERAPRQNNPADVFVREIVTAFGSAKKVEVDPWEMWCLVAE